MPSRSSSGSARQVRVTWESDDVERYTKEALEAGVDTIVAAGRPVTECASEACSTGMSMLHTSAAGARFACVTR